MAHVTFVHGIGNKPAPDVLLEQWRVALLDDDGLDLDEAGVSMSMVHWADMFYREPLPEVFGQESAAEESLAGEHTDEDLGWLLAAPAEQQEFVATLAVKLGEPAALVPEPDVGTGAVPGSTAEVVPFLPDVLKRRLMRRFLIEVHHYLYDRESTPRPGETFTVRTDIRARALATLQAGAEQDGPHVLVGHSLGSVIAYDLLTGVAGAPPVDALLTLGSPLGFSEIQQALSPPWTRSDGWPGRTLGQRVWINVSDRLDPVCGPDPQIAGDFRQAGVQRVADQIVRNRGTWRHGVVKYLGQPTVRSALRAALGEDL